MKLILIAAALLSGGTAAFAQTSTETQDDTPDLRIRVGAGAQTRPSFVGADKNDIVPLVRVSIAKGDNEFRFTAPDDGFGIPLFTSGGFAVGPVGYFQSKRTNEDAGVAIGPVKRTIEAGGFVDYVLNDSIRLRAELRKGIGGHDGLVGQVGADKIWRDGDKYVFSIGPRLLFSNGRYQRAYFGVSPTAALATGLPAYRPGSGLHAVALASGLNLALNKQFGLFGYGRFERLVGDAAKSPFIRQYGSRNQLSAGIGLNYTFTIRR
ncbi:MipA/OmpV family protein [Sphingomonas sp. KRR8]|uniref:MipA/OmpV family protein n=1 Tax=Sphingomonas sp. KRR8 TaxID=2942996 RepID=UPI0020206F9C|nr:MipA/OmpV family protein [Sphingomonas sp. KRR8]URD60278.1 MipA/OmpV family protein [Sphingomonas sp. KRR8]